MALEQHRKWVDLGDGFLYSDEYDASGVRKSLGLDGSVAEKLTSVEKSRLASLLWRTQKITLKEITDLGGWRVPNEKNQTGPETINFYDPPPGSGNQHLQR